MTNRCSQGTMQLFHDNRHYLKYAKSIGSFGPLLFKSSELLDREPWLGLIYKIMSTNWFDTQLLHTSYSSSFFIYSFQHPLHPKNKKKRKTEKEEEEKKKRRSKRSYKKLFFLSYTVKVKKLCKKCIPLPIVEKIILI